MYMFVDTVVATVVVTMTPFSISKDYFHVKCPPDVASGVWSRFFWPLLSETTIRQKYLIFSNIADVALRRCCDGASKEAAASRAFADKEHPTVFTQVLLLLFAK